MAIVLQASDLNEGVFINLLRDSIWPDNARIMAFGVAQARFEFYSGGNTRDLLGFEQGRIFSPEGELKWRKIDSWFRTVYLGEGGFLELADESSMLLDLTSRGNEVLLWGERTDLEPEWLEHHVPHIFKYPFSGGSIRGGRLAMIIQEWLDSAGRVQYLRYVDLIEKGGSYASR
jgi:hypothetical protein